MKRQLAVLVGFSILCIMCRMSIAPLPCLSNPAARHGSYPDELRDILSAAKTADAAREVAGWDGYRPTPLLNLTELASELKIRRLWYKDESQRFGLGSFKALGGAYAVYRVLSSLSDGSSIENVHAAARHVTFACATAGNHGISVAWAAKHWGAQCVVYIPSVVPQQRIDALRAYGAEVRIVGTAYDQAVDKLAVDARRNEWHVVSDTAYPGYVDIPADVMHGYGVLAREILDQLPAGEHITHAFLQCGVGGLASAVIAHLWECSDTGRPTAIVVEPESAACFFESMRQGRLSEVQSEMHTQLVCLACARLSLLAWPVLRSGADFAMTIRDEAAFEGMRRLADASGGAIACGECGASGLGALLTVLTQPVVAEQMKLGRDSNVLVIGSEGPLNARLYTQITGRHSSVQAFD
jgi:diaminopropionate ammonia-lyase